jgi:hypothetical protein
MSAGLTRYQPGPDPRAAAGRGRHLVRRGDPGGGRGAYPWPDRNRARPGRRAQRGPGAWRTTWGSPGCWTWPGQRRARTAAAGQDQLLPVRLPAMRDAGGRHGGGRGRGSRGAKPVTDPAAASWRTYLARAASAEAGERAGPRPGHRAVALVRPRPVRWPDLLDADRASGRRRQALRRGLARAQAEAPRVGRPTSQGSCPGGPRGDGRRRRPGRGQPVAEQLDLSQLTSAALRLRLGALLAGGLSSAGLRRAGAAPPGRRPPPDRAWGAARLSVAGLGTPRGRGPAGAAVRRPPGVG